MLTPMEIHDHQFKKATFRGYNENEVDDFLDKIVVDFEKLLNENERLRTQLYTNEKELEKYRGLEKTMNDTLMMAQRTADEVISSAKKNAEDIKENAARECQQIREQAQFEAKQQIDKAAAKRDAILAEYSTLIRERNTFLVKLRTILESELAITNHVISILPNIDEFGGTDLSEDKKTAEKVSKPEEISKPEETSKPEEISKPKETPKPKKTSKPKKIPTDVDNSVESNIVDISTKPVTEKAEVTDETRTYKPVLDKEN